MEKNEFSKIPENFQVNIDVKKVFYLYFIQLCCRLTKKPDKTEKLESQMGKGKNRKTSS